VVIMPHSSEDKVKTGQREF